MPLGGSALVFLALIISPIFKRSLVNQNITVNKGNPVKLKEFILKPQLIGALRVDVEARISNNQQQFQIQILTTVTV